MRRLLRPILLSFLRRDPAEIGRRALRFRIESEEGRDLVSRLGAAFIRGYNAMLTLPGRREVVEEGMRVESHFRPFFFEGAAMGYLPRGYLVRGFDARTAERDLMVMHPRFRYLYYVGIGLWFGFRHRGRPGALQALAPHLDPMYLPLCYDGFGFKVGFFDYPERASARNVLDRCPPEHRAALHQGFGRALFFVYMDDDEGFEREAASGEPEHRGDLELGRSLAAGFTGIDRPQRLLDHVAAAGSGEKLAARLTGVTWALTAREMNDPDYFGQCLSRVEGESRRLLRRLPEVCRDALSRSRSYPEWQQRTREEAMKLYTTASKAQRS